MESLFEPSDMTDAILVVEGKKLHVNKALLSYHSDYFKNLFSGNTRKKEFPIGGVTYTLFSTLLSFVHSKPIVPDESSIYSLLMLADQFLIPAAKRHIELILISSIPRNEKLAQYAFQYRLNELTEIMLKQFYQQRDHKVFTNVRRSDWFKKLPDKDQVEVMLMYLKIVRARA
ncbi:hypothetical protein CRE_19775 [Caenorhabditis remanei]|uniref:BTB domain-containing protein n=1 Tax=Caenorhabditis remanei TaxID=31234 RepID=E3MT96_CAERE|nr:hypothetical protein CRE_19775 [Caenorhabditis remanei]